MADLVFRRLQQDDAARAAEIVFAGDGSYAAWMPEGWRPRPYEHELKEWRGVLADPRPWKLGAATPQGGLIGVVSMVPDEDDAAMGHLSALFVDPESQGRGVGAALLARCEDEWRRRGMTKGHLWTPAGGPAERFYERRGWRRNGQILWWEAAGMHIAGFAKPLV